MEIKKGQVWECVVNNSRDGFVKGHNYYSNKDGYLYNFRSENVRLDEFYVKEHFKLVEEEQGKTPSYYNNEKGSIYQFCNEQGLNSYEFDIIKRVVRCRKKGLFAEDLQKTKNLIDLYLKEFNYEK